MKPQSLVTIIMAYANSLRFKELFLLILALFLLDLVIPDMIPMIDEIILGLLAILLASWKNENHRAKKQEEGNVIEGEVIREDEKQ